MARIAKKKTVNNNAGLLRVIEGIDEKKVVSVTDFGSFFIVLLKDGAIYHTHIGYEVRCKRWLMDINNERKETTLYNWLVNLVAFKNDIKGKESELFPETNQTNQDMLDYTTTITAANMLHPVFAFSDMDTAAKFATERLNYLREQSEKLEAAMNAEVKEETEDDLAKDFEHGQKAIMAEETAKALSDVDREKQQAIDEE